MQVRARGRQRWQLGRRRWPAQHEGVLGGLQVGVHLDAEAQQLLVVLETFVVPLRGVAQPAVTPVMTIPRSDISI